MPLRSGRLPRRTGHSPRQCLQRHDLASSIRPYGAAIRDRVPRHAAHRFVVNVIAGQPAIVTSFSNRAAAKGCFRRRSSDPHAFSRLACETTIPAKLLRQNQKLASYKPCCRQSSLTLSPGIRLPQKRGNSPFAVALIRIQPAWSWSDSKPLRQSISG